MLIVKPDESKAPCEGDMLCLSGLCPSCAEYLLHMLKDSEMFWQEVAIQHGNLGHRYDCPSVPRKRDRYCGCRIGRWNRKLSLLSQQLDLFDPNDQVPQVENPPEQPVAAEAGPAQVAPGHWAVQALAAELQAGPPLGANAFANLFNVLDPPAPPQQ